MIIFLRFILFWAAKMKIQYVFLLAIIGTTSLGVEIGLRCDMIPEGVTAPKHTQDLDRYEIEISGRPDAYVPEEQYTGK